MKIIPQNQHHDLEVLTPSDLVESATCSIIDPAGPAERPRHAFLARLLTNTLPQLPPPRIVEGDVTRVLDLASRGGDWALAAALAHPDCEFTGVDRCRALVDAASERAAREPLPNASFRHADVLEPPLPFPDQRFDLVHAGFLASFLPGRESWHSLLRECVRITRPGGAIRLVECIAVEANSRACHTLCAAYQQALLHAGLRPALPCISYPQRRLWLDGLLTEVGCVRIVSQGKFIDWTCDRERLTDIGGYLLLTLRLLQPFLLAQGVIDEEEFEQHYQSLGNEIGRGSFKGCWRLHISTGILRSGMSSWAPHVILRCAQDPPFRSSGQSDRSAFPGRLGGRRTRGCFAPPDPSLREG